MEDKATPLTGLSQADFESQRRVLALSILNQALAFIAWDLEFNKHISDLAEELVKQLKTNPRVMESNVDIRDILKEMRSEKGLSSGITGGDIVGGNAWDDIWGVIKEILTGEKDFIKELILKILDL